MLLMNHNPIDFYEELTLKICLPTLNDYDMYLDAYNIYL